jgi:hypothetical protein
MAFDGLASNGLRTQLAGGCFLLLVSALSFSNALYTHWRGPHDGASAWRARATPIVLVSDGIPDAVSISDEALAKARWAPAPRRPRTVPARTATQLALAEPVALVTPMEPFSSGEVAHTGEAVDSLMVEAEGAAPMEVQASPAGFVPIMDEIPPG